MIIQKITKKDSLDIWQWRNDRKSIFFSKKSLFKSENLYIIYVILEELHKKLY